MDGVVHMKIKTKVIAALTGMMLMAGLVSGCGSSDSHSGVVGNKVTLTNVSYDPTRELYESYNKIFQKYWKEKTGQDVEITQSHGGSGKQARSVIEGNEADIVTLALAHDISAIENAGLIEKGWMKEYAHNSAPYTSTIVFLVRKENKKKIADWDDLVKKGVKVITPNPKTSGGACWNFLAAWAYADKTYGGDKKQIKKFMKDLYGNVEVLDSGARNATTTFVENGQGDVLVAWENEAYLSMKEHPDEFEIVSPSISILAEPSVAVVDEVAEERGTKEVAEGYLSYLYSNEAQKLVAENYYRPSNKKILKQYDKVFDLKMNLVTIDEFGGWDQAYEDYFQDGAVFDQIYTQ